MKKIFKALLFLLILGLGLFGVYAYKLHSLAVSGNKIFEDRCANVNPHLIGYKNNFLKYADYLNNYPNSQYSSDEAGNFFDGYLSKMRSYVDKENKWLETQDNYIKSWEFQKLEPWYIKQAAEYQWKMYEGYRDEAKYMLETFDNGATTDEITKKFDEARDRKNNYIKLYNDYYDYALTISDFRKFLANVPLPEACIPENTTIPFTEGAINWNGPSPTPFPINSEFVS